MGCDIHLKLEIRRREEKKHIIGKEERDENGNVVNPELSWTEGTEWRSTDIFGWHNSWSERVYGMFAKLANVRNYWKEDIKPIELRGFPDDATIQTKDEYAYCRVFDTQKEVDEYNRKYEDMEGYFYAETKEQAERDVKSGLSHWVTVGNERRVSCPDWHSPNWCTVSEMEEAINSIYNYEDKSDYDKTYIEWMALLGAMKGYESGGVFECRAIFWFDN